MKLLIISAAFPPMRAGEADHMLHLSRHLAARGLDVHVLTTKGNTVVSGVPFQTYPLMQDWSWTDLPRFVKFLRSSSPDAILLKYVGWIYNDHPMITFAPTIAKTLFPRVPFVTQFASAAGARVHRCPFSTRVMRKGIALWARGKDVDYEFGTLLRDSDWLIVLSDHHRVQLAKLSPSINHKYTLIPPPPILHICAENHGSPRQRGRAALSLKEDEFVIVYFGYIYPSKGVETLLRAFHIVSRQRGHVRLVIIGGVIARSFPNRPPYAQELSHLAKQLGIDERVKWTGEYAWDGDDASLYLRAADLCVLPFDYGVQLNNSSFAAAAIHGLPIVTTQGPAMEQPFVHEENVFLCPPEAPEAMAAAIAAVMDNAELRCRLRTGVLRLAEEWFSWEKAVERTIATFS